MLGNNVYSDLLETKFNYPISKNLSQINPIKTCYNDCTFKLLIKQSYEENKNTSQYTQTSITQYFTPSHMFCTVHVSNTN